MKQKRSALSRIFLLSMAFLTFSYVHSQNGQGMEDMVRTQTDKLYTELPLRDSAQYKQVYDVNLTYARRMQESVQAAGSKMAKLKAAKKVQGQKDAEMKKILSADQYRKYKDIMEERKDKARSEWRNRRG